MYLFIRMINIIAAEVVHNNLYLVVEQNTIRLPNSLLNKLPEVIKQYFYMDRFTKVLILFVR